PRPGQYPGGLVSTLPGHDMVIARSVYIGRHVERCQVKRPASDSQMAAAYQVVFKIGVAKVPRKKRPRQICAVGIPVKQVKGRRGIPHQIIASDVIPYELVGTQE